MQVHSKRIRIIAAAGVVAVAALATGSTAHTKPTAAQLVQLQPDRDGGETYVWKVNGVQRGMAFR